VDVGHQQASAAHHGAFALAGGQIHGNELTKDVVVADGEEGAFAAELQVLRSRPDAGAMKEAVVASDAGRALDKHVGGNLAVIANFNVFANDRVRPDLDPFTDTCPRVNDSRRMYFRLA
jgi:hypothetical protein